MMRSPNASDAAPCPLLDERTVGPTQTRQPGDIGRPDLLQSGQYLRSKVLRVEHLPSVPPIPTPISKTRQHMEVYGFSDSVFSSSWREIYPMLNLLAGRNAFLASNRQPEKALNR